VCQSVAKTAKANDYAVWVWIRKDPRTRVLDVGAHWRQLVNTVSIDARRIGKLYKTDQDAVGGRLMRSQKEQCTE